MNPIPSIPPGASLSAEQRGILPDFSAEVRAVLSRSAALFLPVEARDLIQRMADHIQDLTQRENELRLRVIALEDSAHV